jgi:hypothetical protein
MEGESTRQLRSVGKPSRIEVPKSFNIAQLTSAAVPHNKAIHRPSGRYPVAPQHPYEGRRQVPARRVLRYRLLCPRK